MVDFFVNLILGVIGAMDRSCTVAVAVAMPIESSVSV
jgi:hypothetical protein